MDGAPTSVLLVHGHPSFEGQIGQGLEKPGLGESVLALGRGVEGDEL